MNRFLLLGIFVFTASFGFFFNQKSSAKFENIYDVDANEVAGINSLMSAVSSNDVDGVKFFLKAKMLPVNSKNLGGATALHIACREKNFEIVKILIDSGADVNQEDGEGWTPLMRAALSGSFEITEILISNKASANKVNKVEESAIIHASISDCNLCLKEMFAKYDFINLMDIGVLKSQLNEAFIVANNHDNAEAQKIITAYLDKINASGNGSALSNQKTNSIFKIVSEEAGQGEADPNIGDSKRNKKVAQSEVISLRVMEMIKRFKFQVGEPGHEIFSPAVVKVSKAESVKKSINSAPIFKFKKDESERSATSSIVTKPSTEVATKEIRGKAVNFPVSKKVIFKINKGAPGRLNISPEGLDEKVVQDKAVDAPVSKKVIFKINKGAPGRLNISPEGLDEKVVQDKAVDAPVSKKVIFKINKGELE